MAVRLVVGLGNPGRQYDGTRHNVGYDVLVELKRRWCITDERQQFQALTNEAVRGQHKVLLIRPLTMMNLSGASVLAAKDFFKVDPADILVLCDDFAITLGKLRIRAKGSAGGQKGLANILQRLGTDTVPRVRIGVGPLPTGWDAADFVLGKFSKAEQPDIGIAMQHAADAVESWLQQDLALVMNKYNALDT
jgi:PTH1 family peptidyl-tRNA hydrolase